MKIRNISINSIVEGYSPRRDFSRKEELKGSIEKEGLLDPLLVRKVGENYIVIDGVMRFRVVKELGWKEVDCITIDADEEKSYHLAFIKNTERNNLSPIEVALHLQTIKEKFGYNNEELVRQGYAPHRSSIDDKLSLLSLPEEIQEKISERNEIGPSHGYELAKLPDEESQKNLFNKIVKDGGMSVRKLKREIRSLNVQRKREGDKTLPQAAIPQGDIPGVFFKDSSDMSELADDSAGLIVTSPLYGVGMEYEEDIGFEDLLGILCKVFSECTRVLVPGGKICVNFGDIHNFGSRNGGRPEIKLMGHHYQEILEKLGLRLIETIIWKKCTPGKKDFNWSANPHVNYHQKTKHGSYRILNNTEHIYVFVKDGEREVPFDIEQESKISKDEWKEWVDGVWEIPPVRRQEGHPAQFPEEIPYRLTKLYSYIGDIVLDCFGGTMTTVKVANELGRIGIGYEKDEKYKTDIMEKLGLTEKDLKKPKPEEDDHTKLDDPQFTNKFEKMITQILTENNKTSKDIVSAQFPGKSSFSKDDIQIVWKDDDEDPEPSGPAASSQLSKADDYGDSDTNHSDNQLFLPERCSDISPHLNKVILGDCLEKLKKIPDASVDALATDPPYGIKFMGKNWDKAVPTVEVWREVLRVLKPGAFAFVMSIPRQDCQSRMIRNLEEAGFKVNFSPIYWTYAQGFPKAFNISKYIDKKAGATREVIGESNIDIYKDGKNHKFYSESSGNPEYEKGKITTPATEDAKRLDGSYSGFQPKPAVEVIIVAMKPLDEKTCVDQALKNGKGSTWMDDCRIPYADDGDKEQYAFNMDGNQRTKKEPGQRLGLHDGGWRVDKRKKDLPKGRFPANLLVSDDILDDGKKHPGGGVGGRPKHNRGEGYGFKPMGKNAPDIPKDSGGYSRFFSLDAWAEKNLPFLIVPKPSKNEKGEGNNHPTVKPMKLMSYLITMGSREQDVVLDIFAGSGTTCIAAKILNRKFIGIELNEEYQQIAKERLENAALVKAA